MWKSTLQERWHRRGRSIDGKGFHNDRFIPIDRNTCLDYASWTSSSTMELGCCFDKFTMSHLHESLPVPLGVRWLRKSNISTTARQRKTQISLKSQRNHGDGRLIREVRGHRRPLPTIGHREGIPSPPNGPDLQSVQA